MEQTVFTFEELKSAIQDANIDYIYLGQDIEVTTSGGISFPLTKTSLTIDGTNPTTGIIHTYIDYNSSNYTDSIYINPTANNIKITVKNIILHIRNYYGFIMSYDSSTSINVSFYYENVDFSGTQAIYNRYGKTYISDSRFVIDKLYNSVSAAQELAETNYLELAGNISIKHTSTENSCIWLIGTTPKLIIDSNAIVTINTSARDLIYNDPEIYITLKESSNVTLNIYNSVTYTNYINTFIIENNASLIINQANNPTTPTIRISNLFEINEKATLQIYQKKLLSSSLIQFKGTATFNITNPKSVILYNYGGLAINVASGTITLNISTKQLNYWTSAALFDISGTLLDIPLYAWKKHDNSYLTITASLNNLLMLSASSNLVLGTDALVLITTVTFNLLLCKVLSLGEITLETNEITDTTTKITGLSLPYSTIEITTETDTYKDTCNELGIFSIGVDGLTKNDYVKISANVLFLTLSLEFLVYGSLSFLLVPEILEFQSKYVPTINTIIERKIPNWSIEILDTRDNASDWILSASIDDYLRKDTEKIENGLILLDNDSKQIFSTQKINIYEGIGNKTTQTITTISWNRVQGILIELESQKKYQPGEYITIISWYLDTK